jgi:hypothetical protein
MPSLDLLAFAKTVLPERFVQIEIAKFRDYWHARAGPNAVKLDWAATFRNWCRKAAEIDQRDGHAEPRKNSTSNGFGENSGRGGHSSHALNFARRAAGAGGAGGG